MIISVDIILFKFVTKFGYEGYDKTLYIIGSLLMKYINSMIIYWMEISHPRYDEIKTEFSE